MSHFNLRPSTLLAILLVISAANGFSLKNFFRESAKNIFGTNSEEFDGIANGIKKKLNKHLGEGFDKVALSFVENALDGGSQHETKGVTPEDPHINELPESVEEVYSSEESEESLASEIGTSTTPINKVSTEHSTESSNEFPDVVNGNNETAEVNGGHNSEEIGATFHNVTKNNAAVITDFTTQLAGNFTADLEQFGVTLSNTANNTVTVVTEFTKQLTENFTIRLEEVEAVKTDLIKTGTDNLEEGMKTMGALVDVFKMVLNQNTEGEEASNETEAASDDLTWLFSNFEKVSGITDGNNPAILTLKTVLNDFLKMFKAGAGKNLEVEFGAATNHLNETLNEKVSNTVGAVINGISKMRNGSIVDTLEMVRLIGDVLSPPAEDIEQQEEEDELITANNNAKLTKKDEPGTNSTWLVTEILMGTGAAILVVVGAVIVFVFWNQRRFNNKCHGLKV